MMASDVRQVRAAVLMALKGAGLFCQPLEHGSNALAEARETKASESFTHDSITEFRTRFAT